MPSTKEESVVRARVSTRIVHEAVAAPIGRGRGTVRLSGDSVGVRRPQDLLGRFTLKVQRDGRSFTVDVAADGEGLVSHAGAALLGEVADRIGLTREFSGVLATVRERRGRHDPGRVIRDLAVMLADGGDCLSDLRAVRDQEALFGPVASDSTAFRLIDRIAAEPALLERCAPRERRRANACGVWAFVPSGS